MSTVLSLSAHVTLVAWCFGCAALAASGWSRRRAAVVGAIGVVAIVAYLAELLATIWTPAQTIARFSPFHYYAAPGILSGAAADARNLTILGTTAAVLLALAYWQQQRRDL
jgi:hypothetical protein